MPDGVLSAVAEQADAIEGAEPPLRGPGVVAQQEEGAEHPGRDCRADGANTIAPIQEINSPAFKGGGKVEILLPSLKKVNGRVKRIKPTRQVAVKQGELQKPFGEG